MLSCIFGVTLLTEQIARSGNPTELARLLDSYPSYSLLQRLTDNYDRSDGSLQKRLHLVRTPLTITSFYRLLLVFRHVDIERLATLASVIEKSLPQKGQWRGVYWDRAEKLVDILVTLYEVEGSWHAEWVALSPSQRSVELPEKYRNLPSSGGIVFPSELAAQVKTSGIKRRKLLRHSNAGIVYGQAILEPIHEDNEP